MAMLVFNSKIRSASSVMVAGFWAGVVLAGTGGVSHPDKIGYLPPCIRIVESSRNMSVRVQIRKILEGLEVSVAGLAQAMQVSRQTLYNWLKGELLPNAVHQIALDSFSRAYVVLSTKNLAKRSILIQPMVSSRNFWQLVKEGEDAETLAQQVASTYRQRIDQRALVASRIATKRAKGTLADFDADHIG